MLVIHFVALGPRGGFCLEDDQSMIFMQALELNCVVFVFLRSKSAKEQCLSSVVFL